MLWCEVLDGIDDNTHARLGEEWGNVCCISGGSERVRLSAFSLETRSAECSGLIAHYSSRRGI